MLALRYYGIHDVRTEEMEDPVCRADEVLIKIAYAGVCGSDLHIYNQGMFIQNIPETMGHEFAGVIVGVGKAIRKFAVGDRVLANPMVPCGECASCRQGSYNTCEALGFIGEVSQGCFAGYITMREEKLIRIPPKTDLKEAALSEPLAVAVNIGERAGFQKKDKVLIIGAGPIGLLTAALAKQVYGVDEVTVVDLSESRLAIADRLGVTHAQKMLSKEEKFDKVIEAAGSPVTFRMAIGHTKANGFIYVVSIFEKELLFDINSIVASQITLVGCNVYTDGQLGKAVSLLAEKSIDVTPVISGEYDLSAGKEVFELLSSADKSAAKILFVM